VIRYYLYLVFGEEEWLGIGLFEGDLDLALSLSLSLSFIGLLEGLREPLLLYEARLFLGLTDLDVRLLVGDRDILLRGAGGDLLFLLGGDLDRRLGGERDLDIRLLGGENRLLGGDRWKNRGGVRRR